MNRPLLALALAALLHAAFALTPRPTPTPVPGPLDPPPPPTAAEYAAAIERGSFTSVHYDILRCVRPGHGFITFAHATASTSSGSIPSRFLSHNVRLYVDGQLFARSLDEKREVDYPSATNYVTSLAPVRVSVEISCPRALVAVFGSAGWHKGVSIHGHGHTVTTQDTFHG
jgi:hypothetical protein